MAKFNTLINTTVVFTALVLGLPHYAVADEALDKALLSKVSQAQRQLSATEKNISTEKSALVTRLNKLEQQVIDLQQKTAAARRLSDEKTLSLSQLESRVKDWREQQVYQQNLLNRFIHQQQLVSQPATLGVEQKLALVKQFTGDLQSKLKPTWQEADVVLANGQIAKLPTLAIGPLTWFWSEQEQRAGLASYESGRLQSQLLLDSGDSDSLYDTQQGQGEVVFDPTLNRALARQQHQESAWQHLVKGGMWVIPILVFAFLALIIALYKSVQLICLPRLLSFTPAHLASLLQGPKDAKVLTTVKGKQRKLLDIAIQANNDKQRDDQLFIQLQQDKLSLERWLMVIGITASVAPLLGLLGTVSGMIETFKMMTLFGSGDPEVVSGGIAQALITTELGLVVAIPALVLNAILSKRAKNYYHELENFAILLSQSEVSEANPSAQVAA